MAFDHKVTLIIIILFYFGIHTASAPITSGTHTDGGAVIRQPGSAWLEGTPAMDLGHMNVVLKWMHLYVGSVLRMWNFVVKWSICMLILNVGIVICSIIIILMFCLSCCVRWSDVGFWFLVCYAATQLATQLHQRCTQVVYSKKEARKRLTESNGTPAMDLGHMNVVLKYLFAYASIQQTRNRTQHNCRIVV